MASLTPPPRRKKRARIRGIRRYSHAGRLGPEIRPIRPNPTDKQYDVDIDRSKKNVEFRPEARVEAPKYVELRFSRRNSAQAGGKGRK